MATISTFDLTVIESIAKLLGDTSNGFTGSEITSLLNASKIEDIAPGSTKWKRLNSALVNKQDLDKFANNILAFIEHAMKPSKYINNQEWFNNTRFELNKVLSFAGYSLQENGKISTTTKSYTISEAAAKASMLKEHLLIRKVHPDVLLYCREELLVDNYFHVVFEATKSVADKIRMKTDLNSDGAALADDAFSFKDKVPHLALNTLQTESEQSEQKGFMNLIKGLFGTFRNTTAHAPKIKWSIEAQDALDILSMVSLIHRRLDNAFEARKMYEGKI